MKIHYILAIVLVVALLAGCSQSPVGTTDTNQDSGANVVDDSAAGEQESINQDINTIDEAASDIDDSELDDLGLDVFN